MFCVDMGHLSLARERGGLGSAPGSKSFREVGECNSKPITVILSPSPRGERNAGPACSPNPVSYGKSRSTEHNRRTPAGWSDNQAHGVAFNAQRGCIAVRKNLSSLCRFA